MCYRMKLNVSDTIKAGKEKKKTDLGALIDDAVDEGGKEGFLVLDGRRPAELD